MSSDDCGGCRGQGRHRRWCPRVVGAMSSQLGRFSEQAERMGDMIASNNVRAANLAYQLAAELRRDATERASSYAKAHGTRH